MNNSWTLSAIDASTEEPSVIVFDDTEDMPESVVYTSRFTDFSSIKP